MKKLIVIALLIVGCGAQSESDYYSEKIRDWQIREELCPTIKTECVDTGDFISDVFGVIDQLPNFTYEDEPDGHWNTSCETVAIPKGTCVDYAAITCRAIADSCLFDKYDLIVQMKIVDLGNAAHMVCSVGYDDMVYEVDHYFISIGEVDPVMAVLPLNLLTN